MKFETTKGDFIVEVNPEWAPNGAAHVKELVEKKFYDGCGFFRNVPDFMVQFGMNGDPKVHAEVGRKDDQRRPGEALEQARLRDLRSDRRPEQPFHAALHQLMATTRSSTASGSPRSASLSKA